jgi:hypothetical protein
MNAPFYLSFLAIATGQIWGDYALAKLAAIG